ncbi:MAG: serine hydrolase domain-containing protein [Acidimicrobiales bacterium]
MSKQRRPTAPAIFLTGALLLGAAACSSDNSSGSPDDASAGTSVGTTAGTTVGTTAGTMPMATMDEAALQALLDEVAPTTMTPGAVALVRTPAGTVTATYGYADLDKSRPVTVDDHVRIGSNTKTFTGTAVLQLVGEGKVALDDPISDYVDGVPNGEAITIEMLLDMHSGLYNYTTSPEMNRILDEEPDHVFTPEDLLALAFAQPPNFAPSTSTRTPHRAARSRHREGRRRAGAGGLATPVRNSLGLSQTSFPAATDASIPETHPQGYLYGDNMSTIETMALPEADQPAAESGELLPNDVTDENLSWAFTAGAMISDLEDLPTGPRRFCRSGAAALDVQQQRIDSGSPVNPDNPASPGYGLAIASFGGFLGHTGELPGFNSFMAHNPETDTTVVVWANLANQPDGAAPAVTIAQALLKALTGTADGATPASSAGG